jgi:hypothetical protein
LSWSHGFVGGQRFSKKIAKNNLNGRRCDMGYWDATDQYLIRHGGRAPTCPSCGQEMIAQDDHGRFTCLCDLGGGRNIFAGTRIGQPEDPAISTSEITDKKS